jgi:tRNA threonylcarbamoyladenosine biosynthesis protein TsaE
VKLIKVWNDVLEFDLESLSTEIREIIPCSSAIILTGPVGAGKTTFTKHFVDTSAGEEASSPTYSVINENGDCAHADFYRIKNNEEIIHLEIPLYLEDKNYFLIEWGKPFFKEISRNLEDEWEIFELVFEINSENSSKKNNSSRNIHLFSH